MSHPMYKCVDVQELCRNYGVASDTQFHESAHQDDRTPEKSWNVFMEPIDYEAWA